MRKQDSPLHMAFFDIQLLFSNIPLDETIDICVNRVFQHKKIKRMLKRNVQQFLTLTLKYSYFAFNNMYYKQILGVIMDSPLGPTFANLFWPFM